MHRYVCPMRWGDMDAQAHVNNAAFVDYLQEARVDFLLTGPPVMHRLLDTGVLVVQHQIEYLHPVRFHDRGLAIDLWVESVGGSRFVLGYEVRDGDAVAIRARTTGAPYDLAGGGLRRLSLDERAVFTGFVETGHEPLRELGRQRWTAGGHDHPLRLRWSDLDSYAHANNVKYYDYVQEARIALISQALGWLARDSPTADDVWLVVRQDMDYLRPLDFRITPYRVNTVVTDIGTRSIRLAAQIDDPTTGTVYAQARTVLVGPQPLNDRQKDALRRLAPS
ncbi:MAG TPA: thioesterase family protein [Microlunatus sp.]|nr:thioesterase family protein [Microlunatus sp.]